MSDLQSVSPGGQGLPELKLPNWDMMIPQMPDPEVLAKMRHARLVAPLLKAQAEHPGQTVFPAVSLATWAEQAAASGIPTVPAEVVCRIPVDAIMCFEEQRPEDQVHWDALREVRIGMKADEMLRMDCCASSDMKSMMQDGGEKAAYEYLMEPDEANPAVPTWRTLPHLACMRIFDLVADYPGDVVPVVKRPWIEARREETHPVEYRVFVENGEVKGVANYYVQRNLELTDEVKAEVGQAIANTRQLLDHMQAEGGLPFNVQANKDKNGFDPEKASCTIDFLVDRDGQVLFLEAGPPFGMGAHPCAFMQNKVEVNGQLQYSVEGVCLAVGAPPLPLSDFEPSAKARPKP